MKFMDMTPVALSNATRKAQLAYLEAPKYDAALHAAWLAAADTESAARHR